MDAHAIQSRELGESSLFRRESVLASRAHVGEIRAFAVARSTVEAIVRLEREGWIEADGRLFPVAESAALYKRIGGNRRRTA